MRARVRGRVVLIALTVIVAALPLEGCVRGLGTLARAASRSSRTARNAPKEQVPAFTVTALSKEDKASLAEEREWYARIRERYNETAEIGAEPAVITRLIEAWKADADAIEKPKEDRMITALGAAMGDALAAQSGLQWAELEEDVPAVASRDGMVAVFPFDIMSDWVTGVEHPGYLELVEKVKAATARPGTEPVLLMGKSVPEEK
jgi:hypothetical protein